MEIEEWKDIPGYDGYYQVSNMGRVKSLNRIVSIGKTKRKTREVILKPQTTKMGGYSRQHVGLRKNGKKKTFIIHKLVLDAFVSPKPEGMVGCHNDGNTRNNNLSNLRWGTHKENSIDAIKHGTQVRGEKAGASKLKECEVRLIKHLLRNNTKQHSIAQMFNVSDTTISDIKKEKIWKHIKLGEDNGSPKI